MVRVCVCVLPGQNPKILSISPNVVSFYGKNNVVLYGWNLRAVTRVRIQADTECKPRE